MRIGGFLVICVAFVAWSPSFACSCAYFTLDYEYESSTNVFTAVVTSAKIDKKGNVVAGFEVTEVFKGDIPFEKLETHATGPCATLTTVGLEYLFFLGDSGGFSMCTAPITLRPDRNEPWLELLKAYKSGETPNLSSPWHYNEYDGACYLVTDFLVTEKHFKSKILIVYRYAEPVKETYTVPELTRPGFAYVELEMPTADEPEGSSIEIETQNREFIAFWFHRNDAPYISRNGFRLIADEVIAFAEELLTSSSAVLKGSLSRYGPIDGTEIQTTNAGTEIAEFVSCAKRGTRLEK